MNGVPGSGVVEIEFTGSYPAIIYDRVSVLSTAETYSFGVTSAVIATATPTKIRVLVRQWKSDDLVGLDNSQFIAVLVAPAP